MNKDDFLAALGILGMDVPGLKFEAHGKYLGVRLGPESIGASWEHALQKFVRRIHLTHGLALGLTKAVAQYNMIAFSVLTFLCQLVPITQRCLKLE
eukprot:3293006-Pyramimonas_sp.AAC.1